MSRELAFESSGPGGSLHWKERSDGVWYASAMGQHFEVVPNASHSHGYRTWQIRAGAAPVLLGRSGTLGGAFGLARDQVDRREEAAEISSMEAKDSSGSERANGSERAKLEREAWKNTPIPNRTKSGRERAVLTGELNIRAGKFFTVRPLSSFSDEELRQMSGAKGSATEARETFATVERNTETFDAGKKMGPMTNPRLVYDAVHERLSKESQEVFLVIPLDLHGEALSPPVEIARGQRDRVTIDPADVMAPVIATRAKSFVVIHNHPSGHCKPSDADHKVTASIRKAAKVYDPVTMWDHMVIGRYEFYSITEGKRYKVKEA